MSSIASLVAAHGLICYGQGTPGEPDAAVRAAQLALSQAGYRVEDDGVFGDGTRSAVERLQRQHALTVDGKIGAETARLLDLAPGEIVASATPITVSVALGGAAGAGAPPIPFPHDDTASLLAFYGKPWADPSLLTSVPVPYLLRYHEDGSRVVNFSKVQFHRKAADRLAEAFKAVWQWCGKSQDALDNAHLSWFSGTYNYRAVRGSSRLSCHAFGAAIDLDAEDYPLGSPKKLSPGFVACFKDQGFFWGGDYAGRKDPMHFQSAHE